MSYAILEASELPNEPSRKRGRPTPYPWSDLEVGQGFVIPNGKHKFAGTAHGLARKASARHGKKFKATKQENGDYVIKCTA